MKATTSENNSALSLSHFASLIKQAQRKDQRAIDRTHAEAEQVTYPETSSQLLECLGIFDADAYLERNNGVAY